MRRSIDYGQVRELGSAKKRRLRIYEGGKVLPGLVIRQEAETLLLF